MRAPGASTRTLLTTPPRDRGRYFRRVGAQLWRVHVSLKAGRRSSALSFPSTSRAHPIVSSPLGRDAPPPLGFLRLLRGAVGAHNRGSVWARSGGASS